MGAKSNKEYDNDRPYPHFDMFEGLEVPDTFDARTNWPKCTVIGKVRSFNCLFFHQYYQKYLRCEIKEVVAHVGRSELLSQFLTESVSPQREKSMSCMLLKIFFHVVKK